MRDCFADLERGTSADIEIQAKEIMKLKRRLSEILAKHTGKPFDVVERDTDRDYFMSADEAIAYGLVDKVVSRSPINKPESAS